MTPSWGTVNTVWTCSLVNVYTHAALRDQSLVEGCLLSILASCCFAIQKEAPIEETFFLNLLAWISMCSRAIHSDRSYFFFSRCGAGNCSHAQLLQQGSSSPHKLWGLLRRSILICTVGVQLASKGVSFNYSVYAKKRSKAMVKLQCSAFLLGALKSLLEGYSQLFLLN